MESKRDRFKLPKDIILSELFERDTCDKVLSNHEQIHLKTVHYTCDTCERAFGRQEHLKVHIKNVHEKIREFKCDTCGKSFGIQTSLKNTSKKGELYLFMAKWTVDLSKIKRIKSPIKMYKNVPKMKTFILAIFLIPFFI